MSCPYCSFRRFWRLRREHARCKRCRREWSLKTCIVPEIRSSEDAWRSAIDSFLRDRTLLAVKAETGFGQNQLHKMLTVIRKVMFLDVPRKFTGPVEMDDAFIGPRWHNRRPWQWTGKRGRGTAQQPLIGIFDQKSGKVVATLIPKVRWRYIHPFLRQCARERVVLYTDTYNAYHPAKRRGFKHHTIDHGRHEYVRGEVTVNHIESFWGYVKRRYKITGGLRKDRLHLYLGEWVWRYNHRNWSRETQVKRLITILKERKFGGRK